jgi:hypothetical protein
LSQKQYHRRVALQLLLISGALFALAVSQKAVEQVREAEARAEAEAAVQAPREPEKRSPRTFRAGARTPIPRDLQIEEESEETEEEEERVSTQANRPGAGAADDLVPEEEIMQMLERIMEEEVVDSIEDCLHAWWMLDPALSGRVILEFKLDATGLAEAGIRDHSDVPVGPLTCFATALYAADWPGSEGESTVHYPVVFNGGEEEPGEGLQDTG